MPAGAITRDQVLHDFTLYWLTNTAISSAHFYRKNCINLYNGAGVSVPAAVSVFPRENYQAPRSKAERPHHKVIYYNRIGTGGITRPWSTNGSSAKSAHIAGKAIPRMPALSSHVSHQGIDRRPNRVIFERGSHGGVDPASLVV